jgi:hypothetical protein
MRRRTLSSLIFAISLSLLTIACGENEPTVTKPLQPESPGGLIPAAAPVAPVASSPANGASVTVPVTISWSTVSDPSGIVAYNWQLSPSASFDPLILLDSTNGATSDVVSGLAPGTYFWRVQGVNSAFEQGAWSTARSFTVTGAGPETPGTPTLGPTVGTSTFHPYEVMQFQWSPVSDAVTYRLEISNSQSFPVGPGTLTVGTDNIPQTIYALA